METSLIDRTAAHFVMGSKRNPSVYVGDWQDAQFGEEH
jgi:hypothetical protein